MQPELFNLQQLHEPIRSLSLTSHPHLHIHTPVR